MHQGCIVRYCINHLIFVCPPIGKRRTTCTMLSHFISYLISFQNMSKSIHFKIHFIRYMHQHINFRLNVGMTRDISFPIQNFNYSFQVQISSKTCFLLLIGNFIFFGASKIISINLFHSHSGIRKSIICT